MRPDRSRGSLVVWSTVPAAGHIYTPISLTGITSFVSGADDILKVLYGIVLSFEKTWVDMLDGLAPYRGALAKDTTVREPFPVALEFEAGTEPGSGEGD